MNRPCARVQGRVTALVQRALMAGAAYGVWGQAHRSGTGCLAQALFPQTGSTACAPAPLRGSGCDHRNPAGLCFSRCYRGPRAAVVNLQLWFPPPQDAQDSRRRKAGRPSDRRRQRRRRQQRRRRRWRRGASTRARQQQRGDFRRYLAAARPASEGPTRQYCNRARRPAASPGEDGRREWYYSRVVRRWCGGRGERRTAVRASVAIPRAAVRQVRAAATGSPIWSSTRGPHHEPHHEPFRNSPIEARPSKHTIRGMPLAREDIVKFCRFLAQHRVASSTSPPSERRGN